MNFVSAGMSACSDILNILSHTVYICVMVSRHLHLLQDLLRPENENLQIRESDTGVFVAGVHETEVKGMEDCLHLLQLGERNRYSTQQGQQRE